MSVDEQTPEGGVPSAGDHPHYFNDPIMDCLTNMVLELAAEVWVNRERMLVFEQLLAEHDLIGLDAVENFEPSQQQQGALREERDRFIAGIMREIRRLAQQRDDASNS